MKYTARLSLLLVSLFLALGSFLYAQDAAASQAQDPQIVLDSVIAAEKAVKDQEAKIAALFVREPYETDKEFADRKLAYDDGGVLAGLKQSFSWVSRAFSTTVYRVPRAALTTKIFPFDRDTKSWKVVVTSADKYCPAKYTTSIDLSKEKDLAAAFNAIDSAISAGMLLADVSYSFAYDGGGAFTAKVTQAGLFNYAVADNPALVRKFNGARRFVFESPAAKPYLLIREEVFVQGGAFMMGTKDEAVEAAQPVHKVTLDDFIMSKYEAVTDQFEYITANLPGTFLWEKALQYCNDLSLADELEPCYTEIGKTYPICNWKADGYRLPTEAEWEYAALGGRKSKNYKYPGSNDPLEVGNIGNLEKVNYTIYSKPVGSLKPNELGIFDMAGNVSEWCWDIYADDAYEKAVLNNPKGPAKYPEYKDYGSRFNSRVIRGGEGYDGRSGSKEYILTFRSAARGEGFLESGSNGGIRTVRRHQ